MVSPTPSTPSAARRIPSGASPFSSPSSSAILSASSGTLPPRPKALYSHAARAFLQRDYLNALLTSQEVVELLKDEDKANADINGSVATADPASSAASLPPQSNHDLVTKTLILRLTLLSNIYCTPALRTQTQSALAANNSPHAQAAAARLAVDPSSFAAQAWQEVLSSYAEASVSPALLVKQTLEPVPDTLSLALNVPAKVLAAAVMATLRLDEVDTAQSTVSSSTPGTGTGCRAARSICEWFLAAHSASQEGESSVPLAQQESYARIMELYTLHVLGARAAEWDYAAEIVRYSQLEIGEAESLLARLTHARSEMQERPERARLASAAAKEAYEAERSRRAEAAIASADEEVAQREAARAKGQTKPDFAESIVSSAAGGEAFSRPELARSTSTSSSTASASGSHRRSRKSSSTSNTSNSSKGAAGDAPQNIPNETSANTFTRRSSSASRKEHEREALRSSATSPSAAAATTTTTDQNDYASARSSVSRFVEKSHRRDDEQASRLAHSSSGPLVPRNSAGAPASRPHGGGAASQAHQLLDTLRALLPHQLRFLLGLFPTLVGALLVALFVWRRSTARPSEGRGSAGVRVAESEAARRVRAQLRGERGGTLGWARGAVSKVWETVRMGTQVTYL